MKFYRHLFTVRGNVPFPPDMLRYDGCYPADSTSANNIHWSITRDDTPDGIYTVRLVKVGHKGWQPTYGRWESFLWHVVAAEPIRSEPIP